MSSPKVKARITRKVKVRIMVAIDQRGTWAAYGASGLNDEDAMVTASDARAVSDEGLVIEGFHVVETRIPVPKPETFPGDVVEATMRGGLEKLAIEWERMADFINDEPSVSRVYRDGAKRLRKIIEEGEDV